MANSSTMMTERRFRLGLDIGGTFTDLTLIDESGDEVHGHKVPSTSKSPSVAMARGVRELMARIGSASSAKTAGLGVHSFVPKWRARRDSNP